MNTSTTVSERPAKAGRHVTPTAALPVRRLSRSRRLFRTLLVAGALVLVTLGAMRWMDAWGWRFFHTGRDVVLTLDQLGLAFTGNDQQAMGRLVHAGYAGAPLGLTGMAQEREVDGIRRLRFAAARGTADRAAALAEWAAYRDGFASVESARLHLDRFEEWSGDPIRATVRLEVIGVPRGAARSVIDRASFRMSFDRGGDARPTIRSAALVTGERYAADHPQFADVAPAAGIDFTNRYYPPFLNDPHRFGMIRYGPGGITTADYDNDGAYDLFIPDGVESRLFRNTGDGRFEDVTSQAGLGGLDGVSVGLFADYDNDGRKDLFVSRTYRPNQLFHQEPDGRFRDVTAASGLGADCCTTVASWADYDNDGDLDLYVGRYLDPRTAIPTTFYARNGEPNQLYRNDGQGRFTNVTAAAGVGDLGLCLGTVFGDYNDDGYPDLYVANDFGRKTLYRNNRDGTFTDVTVASGTLAYGAGMNASMADYDNDGRLDLYVTHIRSEHAWFAEAPTVARYMVNSFRQGVWMSDMPLYWEMFRQSGFGFVGIFQQMASGNTLLRNRGDGTFEDATAAAGANPPGWFWGASFGDFDNDGWQDIYAADGWAYNDPGTEIELEFLNNVVSHQDVYKTGKFFDPAYFGRRSWHGFERNRHLRNNGNGTFEEIGHAAGTDLLLNSRGVAVADFWNRGVLDIAVSASTDRHALLRNDLSSGRSWLAVELTGRRSNRDAVGARVRVNASGKTQMREVTLGDGYGSQNTLRQHFGLGAAMQVDLAVTWPASGATQTFRAVPVNRIVQITEGEQEYRTREGLRPQRPVPSP